MKRVMIGAVLALMAAAPVKGQQNVCVDYDVQYKLGFIDKSVGTASLNVSFDGNNLYGTLNGHTIPWDGRIYSVTDTLQASMHPSTEVISYVNGWYTKPHVGESASLCDPADFRNILGQGALSASDNTMEAVDITANMIGLFYYTQTLDFARMQPGTTVKIPIFRPDGSHEQVHITYNGLGRSRLDSEQFVFNIVANYSYQGTMSNYPVDIEVSTTTLLPTFISADIAIGHVQMVLK